MLEGLLKAIGVITMTDQQRTLLAQKDAIQQAANRLLAVVAEIEATSGSCCSQKTRDCWMLLP